MFSSLGKHLEKKSWLTIVDFQLSERLVCEVNTHVVRMTGSPLSNCLCPDQPVLDFEFPCSALLKVTVQAIVPPFSVPSLSYVPILSS